MNLLKKLIGLVCAGASALLVGGCPGPSQTTSASKPKLSLSARQVVGVSLIGARGATTADQDKIDDTAAGLCGAGVWTKSECQKHEAGLE